LKNINSLTLVLATLILLVTGQASAEQIPFRVANCTETSPFPGNRNFAIKYSGSTEARDLVYGLIFWVKNQEPGVRQMLVMDYLANGQPLLRASNYDIDFDVAKGKASASSANSNDFFDLKCDFR
jgi:hypothetical protein